MRNIVDERPDRNLHGRLAWSREFVAEVDCAGKDVLDIGCGFGWFELLALDREVRTVTGIEPTEDALETVRRHVHDSRATFVTGTAIDLPFANESFDTIVCWEVLEHLPAHTEGRAFAEFARVLRPGGALYLSTPYDAPLTKLTDPAWWLAGHRHYSRGRVAALAADVALDIERLDIRGRHWEIAQILNLYVSKWIFRRRQFFERAMLKRLDREWRRSGYANVFLRARKPAIQ